MVQLPAHHSNKQTNKNTTIPVGPSILIKKHVKLGDLIYGGPTEPDATSSVVPGS